MQNRQHVVIEQNTAERWYDNPDISDILFATFALKDRRMSHPSLCLHTYDRVLKKGLNNFKLTKDEDEETYVWKAKELVENLGDRVLYHPILTVSTTDRTQIDAMFNNILDGIDGVKESNGVPAVIIIPVLMHHDHFGTFAIKPGSNGKKAEVYYFNPLGTMLGYSNEERPMFDYMKKRYGINESQGLVFNSTEAWQTDGNQCGPYAIWFVREVAAMVYRGELNAAKMTKLFSDIWKMGVDTTEGKAKAIKIRNEQAIILEGVNTNFSVSIFLQFKSHVFMNKEDWHIKNSDWFFGNSSLKAPWKQEKELIETGIKISDLDGIDAFELQKETQELLLKHRYAIKGPLSRSITKTTDSCSTKKPESAGYGLLPITLACVLGGGVLGGLVGYAFKTSINIPALRLLASCFSPSQTASAIVTNAFAGSMTGLIAAGVNYCYAMRNEASSAHNGENCL